MAIIKDSFNLDPPPHFRGLDPNLPIRRYVRHLPHWRQTGATYFATFRLADSLPRQKLDELQAIRRDWEWRHPEPRSDAAWEDYARTAFRAAETYMDQGLGACWFSKAVFADEMKQSLLHFQNMRYFLSSFAIMPNHCHLTIKPFEGFELEDLLGAIKRFVARFVNRRRGQSGELWQQECYDRIVRDEEHLWRVIEYIGQNPTRAGIDRSRWYRWIEPTWRVAGWDVFA